MKAFSNAGKCSKIAEISVGLKPVLGVKGPEKRFLWLFSACSFRIKRCSFPCSGDLGGVVLLGEHEMECSS